jgi:hypothetical protein
MAESTPNDEDDVPVEGSVDDAEVLRVFGIFSGLYEPGYLDRLRGDERV